VSHRSPSQLIRYFVVAVLAVGCEMAAAQVTATKSLTLSASLTAQCRVATASSGAITLTFAAYTAFGAAVTAPTQTVNFECTRSLTGPPTFAWDVVAGTATATGDGVLAGLRYALTAANGTRSNGVAPVLATAGDIGTPDTYPVNVGGSMPSGQAGAGASGTYTTTRTLTVTF
jgi:hypothetical protein